MNPDPARYLEPCDAIDFRSAEVAKLARRLSTGDVTTAAKRCFAMRFRLQVQPGDLFRFVRADSRLS